MKTEMIQVKTEVSPKDFYIHNNKGHLKGFQTNLKHFFNKCPFRLPRAGRMGKFLPFLEPIRLQDLLNSAPSRTAKK